MPAEVVYRETQMEVIMGNESGTWVMYGVSEDDPQCIHTVEQAIE